jgi:glyoxylase-like metal-dependent hydrolase (beta-lactamase superfamily II)
MTATLIALPVLSIPAVPAPALLHLSDYGRELPIVGYAWLYRPAEDAAWTLIDTGTEQVAAANVGRPPERCWQARPLVELLADHGIAVQQVADVIVTHLHHDHCGAIERFPNARWHVPAVEWQFVVDPQNADLAPEPLYPRPLFERMARHGVCPIIDGARPVSGLRMVHLGGHTVGSMAVEVLDGSDEVRVVLGGDVMPLYENLARGIPPGTLWHWGECRRALARLAAYRVPVLPSHDPKVLEEYLLGVVSDGTCAAA